MTVTEFLSKSLSELAVATGIDKGNLSRYFNGALLEEKTINRMAKALSMRPEEVLLAINLRRERNSCVNQQQAIASN